MSVGDSSAGDDGSTSGPPETRTRRGTITDTSLPHWYRENGLEWELTECTLTGGGHGEREVGIQDRPGTQFVSLVGQRDWETATLSGTVTVPEPVYEFVVPASERTSREDPPTRLAVEVDCKAAILRDATVVAEPAGPGTYEVEIELSRARVYDVVRLAPVLVRADAYSGAAPNYGTEAGHRLAAGAPAAVDTDLTEDVHGLLHPESHEFGDDPDFPPESHLVHLVLEGDDAPKLYLNGDHEDLVKVLDTDVNQGYDARLRDVAFDYVEALLWPQLVKAAATGINPEGEFDDDWQADVLDEIHDVVYPDRTRVEAALQLREDVDDREANARLQRDLEDFVQSRLDAPSNLNALLKLIKE